LGTVGTPTASSGINGFVVTFIFIGCARRLSKILARTSARINETAIAQPFPGVEIGSTSFTLQIGTVRAATVRTFTPADTEPSQVLNHGTDKLRPRALWIKVFVAKDQRALMINGSLRSNPERARMADMQQASRRGRKASTIRVLGLTHLRILTSRHGNSLGVSTATRRVSRNAAPDATLAAKFLSLNICIFGRCTAISLPSASAAEVTI
jgi:hypothetical protein